MSDELIHTLRQANHYYTKKAADLIEAQADRIETLEAALRGIIDYVEDSGRDYCEWYHDTKEMARAALAGGKP